LRTTISTEVSRDDVIAVEYKHKNDKTNTANADSFTQYNNAVKTSDTLPTN